VFRLKLIAAVLTFSLCERALPGYDAPFFMALGDLPGGLFDSFAGDVSADGLVVVGGSVTSGLSYTEPFRWTLEEGMTRLPSPNNFTGGGTATGVSGDGQVIVGTGVRLNGRGEGFVWTAQTGWVGVGDLPGGPFLSACHAVSADARVVVGYSLSGTSRTEGFRWTAAEEMVPLGDLPGGIFVSIAIDASADGSVIVGGSASGRDPQESNPEAFRWTVETGMVGLGDLPGGEFNSGALAVSCDGRVIAGQGRSDRGVEVFRWTADEGMVALPNPFPGSYAITMGAMSGDGSIICGSIAGALPHRVYIWDAQHGTRDLQEALVNDYGLDLQGYTLGSVAGISDDGRTIVGTAKNPNDFNEAWIAYLGPVPCPPDLTGDRTIDERDLMVLLESFGLDAGGDTDNDADTDLTDLAILLSAYGTACP